MLAFQDDYPEKRPRGSEPPLRFITAALWGDDLDPRRSARSSRSMGASRRSRVAR